MSVVEKVGQLPTVLVKTCPLKTESFEWNIQISPQFFCKTQLPKCFVELPDQFWCAGVMGRSERFREIRSNLSREGETILLSLRCHMPSQDEDFYFRMKPLLVDFMVNRRILNSNLYDMKCDGKDGWIDDDYYLHSTSSWDCWVDLSFLIHESPTVNNIRLSFFIELYEKPTAHLLENSPSSSSCPPPIYSKMGTFLNSCNYSDVLLCCQDKEFQASRLVLSASSSVFCNMFKNNLRETKEGRVVIGDMDSTALENLLLWMYTGVMDCEDYQGLVNIMKAAHKYWMEDLKHQCAFEIGQEFLNIDTALEIYALGDTYEELELMERAKELVKIGKRQVFQDEHVCQEFMKSYPGLIRELFLQ